MTADADLAALASLCGIFEEFRDLEGVVRLTSPDTQRALLRANGLAVASAGEVRETLADLRAEQSERPQPPDVTVICDQPISLTVAQPMDWRLLLEGETGAVAEGRAEGQIDLPALPMGLHQLHLETGRGETATRLIAAPARTPSLQDVSGRVKGWGVVAALYGLRSARNAGLGDYEDLAQLAETLGAQGAGFLGLNPVHALGWAAHDVISPYSPTHRGFLNANHLALDKLHGAASSKKRDPEPPFIDYASHRARHQTNLKAAFEHFQTNASAEDRASLHAFSEAGGRMLQDFARFECLSFENGLDWRLWQENIRSPEAARGRVAEDMPFHIWLQWHADRQLGQAQARAQAAGMPLGLYLDLAIGARRDGAEAWSGAETIAHGVSLGAPPDHLSPAGQNWQLAAYAPRQLAAHDYAPLRQILRQVMRHCGILRIDHVLGLSRSYWIPDDGSPGGYIRQSFEPLMAIIAIEAQRAGTVIVGEDLGLVPDGFRQTMAAKGVYGYTVLQYEKTKAGRFRAPGALRRQSLACFGTHDTPTIAGFWSGRDIDWWHRLGWIDAAARKRAERQRAREKADLLKTPEMARDQTDVAQVTKAVHRRLADGPTALAAVQLDDVLGQEDAQNLPGTVDEHPNWRRKCPVAVEDLARHEGLARTAQIMAEAGRSAAEREI